jgi:deoxyribose-phosphate aldolase
VTKKKLKSAPLTAAEIARMIDHALLHPTLTDDDIVAGCGVARRLGVATACVPLYAVPLAAAELVGSATAVSTVIGFPHGSIPSDLKAAKAEWACRHGASELDMVINIGKALAGDWRFVEHDIRAVVAVAHRFSVQVKVIFETDFITDDQAKIRLCQLSAAAGADWVKTSTGFAFVQQPSGGYECRGATEPDVRLMRAHTPPGIGVKASGGIRTLADARRLIACGATRLGTSASAAIVGEMTSSPNPPARCD